MAKIVPLTPGSFPPLESGKLASEFAAFAIQDARAAKLLFSRSLYGLSVFHAQQGVEKATKAVGLLMGLVEPKDLATVVGHNSLNAVILSLGDYIQSVIDHWDESMRKAKETPDYEKAVALVDLAMGLIKEYYIKEAKNPEDALIREKQAKNIPTLREGLAKTGADIEKVRDVASLRKQLETLRGTVVGQKGYVWKSTMGLQANPSIDNIVSSLGVRAAEAEKELDGLRKLKSPRLAKLLSDSDQLLYLYYVHRIAFQMSMNLAALTLGHEEATRYPPIRARDFWTFNAYTEDSKMVKLLPDIIKWTMIYCEATMEGSNAVLSHYAKTQRAA